MDHRRAIISYLEREGLALIPTGSGDDYRVVDPSRRAFLHGEPVFTLPADLLSEYLVEMSERYRDQPDPLGEALSLTRIHAMEYLTTDHGDGLNATMALGFRRTTRGDVEFFVEQDIPSAEFVEPSADLEWRA
ncbi:hypothetical protein [Pseudonocardia nigra]|uniref:hypothetical protein n=1 Tax=Pseudonocardia nigra TaxID=1921578 RepID=UPI001C5D5739|nr:hypothetical protein [Pseudonocardia nigra]